MSKRTKPNKKIDTAIVVAIIGLTGTIITAILSSPILLATAQKTPEPSIALTETPNVSNVLDYPTATLLPATQSANLTTPEILTPTPSTTTKNYFAADCINTADWTPYLDDISETEGCWDFSKRGIVAENGILTIVVQASLGQGQNLYTSIPEKGTINFKLKIDSVVSKKVNEDYLVFGVGTSNRLANGGFIFFRPRGTPESTAYFIEYGDTALNSSQRTFIDKNYQLGVDIPVSFQFNKLAFDVYVNNSKVVSDIPLPTSDTPVFWIRYYVPVSSKLVATISDFIVEK
jgi:hypothetical protein